MHYSTLLSVAVAAFTLTPSILTHAIPKPVDTVSRFAGDLAVRVNNEGPTPMGSDNEDDAKYIEAQLKIIEDMPDSVIDAGDAAVKEWALAHGAGGNPQAQVETRSLDDTLEKRQGWLQVLKCAFAVGKAVAENAFPISKLRRIRELIGVLGGARQVAKMLLKAKTIKQMIIIGGPELQELAEIFLGVGDIVRACFEF